MKTKFPPLVVLMAVVLAGFGSPASAVEKGNEWVSVPAKWLLSRFVRPSTVPARTYRVAIAVSPTANISSAKPRVVQSSGFDAVDAVAGDFARQSIRSNDSLRNLLKSKELYFQLSLSPPALDVNLRSEAARRPIPAGHEVDNPTASSFFVGPNQNETTSSNGQLVVVFPAEGGFASAAIVTSSTGNAAVDRYYLHTAALNWRTTRKSSQDQVIRDTFGAARPQRWESILDH